MCWSQQGKPSTVCVIFLALDMSSVLAQYGRQGVGFSVADVANHNARLTPREVVARISPAHAEAVTAKPILSGSYCERSALACAAQGGMYITGPACGGVAVVAPGAIARVHAAPEALQGAATQAQLATPEARATLARYWAGGRDSIDPIQDSRCLAPCHSAVRSAVLVLDHHPLL